MFFPVLLFLLFYGSFSIEWCNEPLSIVNPKVIGGQTTAIQSFPFQVAVISLSKDGYGMLCGGTVLDDFHVLTAGHCTGSFSSTMYVLVGLSSLSQPRYTLDVRRSIRHPGFDEVTISDDIAILEVKKSLYDRGAVPICLTKDDSSLLSGKAIVSGFGLHIVGNLSTYSGDAYFLGRSDSLLSTEIPLIPMEECRREWKKLSLGTIHLSNRQLCAGDVMKGSSSGDSGGPLLVRDTFGRFVQIGITSFGASGIVGILNQRDYPGVYTRVSAYSDWIDLVTSTSFSTTKLFIYFFVTTTFYI